MRRLGAEADGQASVELVAVLPVATAVALAAAQVLAAGWSAELAGHAAEAGAIALGREEDPRAAARDALPGWSRDRVGVRISGRSVRVRLPPPTFVPGLAGALTATAHADAGPRP
jgi:hypothetical protein